MTKHRTLHLHDRLRATSVRELAQASAHDGVSVILLVVHDTAALGRGASGIAGPPPGIVMIRAGETVKI